MNDEMENIDSDGPMKESDDACSHGYPSETCYLCEDNVKENPEQDYDEGYAEDPEAMTGGMGVAAASPAYSSGGIVSTAVHSGTGSGGYSGVPWSGGYPSTTTTTTAAAKPDPKIKDVELPRRITRKVLVAFIDQDETDPDKDIVWAKNLYVKDVDITFDVDGGEMNLHLLLRDIYGNEE